MTTFRLSCAAFAAAVTLAPLARAQQNPPPWWRVNDEVTVSLAWDFNSSLNPVLQVVPSWYSPAITQVTTSPNVVSIPTLAGHTGVLGITGTGAPQSAAIGVKVDNEYHIDWIKIFWFQFDMFEGSSGEITAQIEQDLLKYGRASVRESSVAIGNGWQRVTIDAKLIPQPDDEKIDWSLLENAFGTVAIDNLFVNSKCVKPGDEKGKALGDMLLTDTPLNIIPSNADVRAAAVTEGPSPTFARTIWVSSQSTAGANQLFQLNQNATAVIAPPTVLPDLAVAAPFGAQDLAVENAQVAPGVFQQFVYALVDRRPSGGNVVVRAVRDDGTLQPARDVVLTGFPATASQRFGLAFDPTGSFGAGTFWVSDPNGIAYEFDRAGALLDTVSIPTGVVGLGYDDTFGHFLGFSNTPRATPTFGASRVNGFEWSAYDNLPTGVEFCGDLRIPNPGGPAGGVASGFEVYRTRATGELRMIAVVQLTTGPVVYELAGPFRFGWSQLGQCGMRGGPAFEGSPTFQITLERVPHTLIAALYGGFSNDISLGVPLPASLATIGMTESYLSISPDVSLGAFLPTGPGEFSTAIHLPPAGGLSYVPLFFQWIALDPTVPSGLAMSPAGKTVAY